MIREANNIVNISKLIVEKKVNYFVKVQSCQIPKYMGFQKAHIFHKRGNK